MKSLVACGRTDVTKPKVSLRNFATVPKSKAKQYRYYRIFAFLVRFRSVHLRQRLFSKFSYCFRLVCSIVIVPVSAEGILGVSYVTIWFFFITSNLFLTTSSYLVIV
jgi:hypothetical protein